jgi:hypothetical protein
MCCLPVSQVSKPIHQRRRLDTETNPINASSPPPPRVWTNFRRLHPTADPKKCAMLSTAVSSKALAAMAKAEGFTFRETLTGFKWLGNVAAQMEGEGFEVLFAYEEAIGFMFNKMHKVRL